MSKAKLPISSLTATFWSIIGVSTLLLPQSAIAMTLGFENGFDDWDTSGTTSIEEASFGSSPTEGIAQAFLSTAGTTATPVFQLPFLGESLEGGEFLGTPFSGFLFSGSQISDFGNTLSPTTAYTQGSAIKTSISVNAGDTLKFDYNFLSNEDSSQPLFGNDLAFFSLDNQLIDLAIFTDVEPSLAASATFFSRETNYQEYSHTFASAGDFILGFGVVDGNETGGDSGLLVDNIRIESQPDVVSVPEPLSLLGTLAAIGLVALLKKEGA